MMNLRTLLKPLMIAGMILVPGSVLAGDAEQGCCLQYDGDNDRLFAMVGHGNVNAQVVTLNNVGQAIRGIIDPEILPAGKCRGVAIRWNAGIILGKDSDEDWQRRIFSNASQLGCNVTFIEGTDDAGNPTTEQIWLATK